MQPSSPVLSISFHVGVMSRHLSFPSMTSFSILYELFRGAVLENYSERCFLYGFDEATFKQNCEQAAGCGYLSRNRVEDLYSCSQEVTCRENPFRSFMSTRCTLRYEQISSGR